MRIHEAIQKARKRDGAVIRRYAWGSRHRSIEMRAGEQFVELERERGKTRASYWSPTYDDLAADDWAVYCPCFTRAPYVEESTWRDPIQGRVEEARIVVELDGDDYLTLSKSKEWQVLRERCKRIENRHSRKHQSRLGGSEETASSGPYESPYFPWESGAPSQEELEGEPQSSLHPKGSEWT